MKPVTALIIGVVVALLAIVGPSRLDRPGAGGETFWSRRVITPPPATPKRAVDVPELRGRPAQRDVDPSLPEVRRYRRAHRLAGRLPLTAEGVTFTAAGRFPDGRSLIAATAAGRTASETRHIYRRLLRATRDRGTAYRLVIDRPKDLP